MQKYLKIIGRFPKLDMGLQKFRKAVKGLQKSSVLDSFSDSLPCILDWFGKGFKALQDLDSSCNLASILLCHGIYQVLPHSWLVLMIKKLSKTSKLAKNWLVTLARVLNVPIKLKGNKYYSKVFKRVYKKLQKINFWVVITRPMQSAPLQRSSPTPPNKMPSSPEMVRNIIWSIRGVYTYF